MIQIPSRRSRQIGPIGTLGRLGLGVILLVAAFIGLLGDGVSWLEGAAALVALPAAILLLHVVAARVVGRQFEATGALGFCANIAFGAALFSFDATRELTTVFYGASLLLAAARGYAGCEVLAVSNFLLRRQDQVGCLLFSPLDEVETRVSGARVSQSV